MINAIVYLFVLICWVWLGYCAVESIRTGRLQPFSSMLEKRGRAPILRATTIARFYALWLAVICMMWVSAAATFLFLYFVGPV